MVESIKIIYIEIIYSYLGDSGIGRILIVLFKMLKFLNPVLLNAKCVSLSIFGVYDSGTNILSFVFLGLFLLFKTL